MNLNLGKLLLVSERREDPFELDELPKIQITLYTVFESKMDAIASKWSDLRNVFQHRLPQRLDGFERSLSSCQVPVLHEFGLMAGSRAGG